MLDQAPAARISCSGSAARILHSNHQASVAKPAARLHDTVCARSPVQRQMNLQILPVHATWLAGHTCILAGCE